jgi:asparagine synthase (glutamine-hydrolysing)
MIDTLMHRGPDDRGLFFENEIALAHARLSILDLSPAGHQPMFSYDKKTVTIFNGEIYNFLEIREDLKLRGHKFKSDSDTEVILVAYEEFGENCFEKFEGMFAIAIYDFAQKKLLLARDRMGEKPLYWTLAGKTLIFGSEMAALTKHPLFKKEIDLFSLSKYFSFDYIPTPHTIYKNVHKLEPGTFLSFQNGEIKKKTFWKMKFGGGEENFENALQKLDQKLNSVTKKTLVSDVPLGVFLSGGLDSSTVAYYASKNSDSKINTYSIGFEEKSFDESKYALQVANFLGTKHHMKIVKQSDIVELVQDLGKLLDEPMADPSIIPTFILSKFAHEQVTVALGGDGGDELFAGYPTFQAEMFADLYLKIPAKLRGIIEKLINKLPVSEKNFSLEFKLKKFIAGVKHDKKHRHQNWLGNFDREEKSQLFRSEIWNQIKDKNDFEDIDNFIDENKIEDPRQLTLALYMKTYLMDQVLVKVDRASMKTSLETRAPFLNHELVDYVNALPYGFKFKRMTGKYILKKLMVKKLPSAVVNRKKKGFGIPLAKWLREDLRELCENVLSQKNIENAALFNYDFVEKLKEQHLSKKKDNRRKLWSLIVFQLWLQK